MAASKYVAELWGVRCATPRAFRHQVGAMSAQCPLFGRLRSHLHTVVLCYMSLGTYCVDMKGLVSRASESEFLTPSSLGTHAQCGENTERLPESTAAQNTEQVSLCKELEYTIMLQGPGACGSSFRKHSCPGRDFLLYANVILWSATLTAFIIIALLGGSGCDDAVTPHPKRHHGRTPGCHLKCKT